MAELEIQDLLNEAAIFAKSVGQEGIAELYGVTDGKAVGTYLEHRFRAELATRYQFEPGNSASGIDFPSLQVDMKVTSRRQPQSSCPFKSARQKIYGLGYSLLVFVYDKEDTQDSRTTSLKLDDVVYVKSEQTADFQTTRGIREIVGRDGNQDDLIAFMYERNLPLDEIEMKNLAFEILESHPLQGYLTISNALQWRLQYGRILSVAGQEDGVISVWQEFRN